MTRLVQAAVGRCAFLDVLEEAAVRRTPVRVEQVDGAVFVDTVQDVVTHQGDQWVVFATHPTVSVRRLTAPSRAAPRQP